MVIYSEMHPSKTLEKLNFQRLTTDFTDVTVAVAGRQFSLHKSILAAYSSLFCSVFQDVAAGESAPNINLDGVDAECFSIIIDFVYTSKLDATPTNINQLQTAAEFLQMPEVIELCDKYKKKDDVVKQHETDVKSFIEAKKVISNTNENIILPVELEDKDHNAKTKISNSEEDAKMMVEVYQSNDGTFAKEEEHILHRKTEKNHLELVYTRCEVEEAQNTRRRGRRLQARVVCQVCNKTFTRQRYEVHKRTHTGEKPYQCNVCEKQFVSIYNLKIHERIHTGERPYHCNRCNKTFADPSTTRKHLLWHDGIKTKQCDLCGKYFSNMSQVREHRRTHTKEKPHICTECGKSYSYRCDLKRHMREHTGDMIGPCAECGRYFNHRSNYLSHLKTHIRKSNAQTPQLKLQDSGLMTTDGKMILKAKIEDISLQTVLVLPEEETADSNSSNLAFQETITSGENPIHSEQIHKPTHPEDDEEIEVTINNGKLYVKHSKGVQSSTILDGSQIILKDEGLQVATTDTSSTQCGTSISADHVLMLVQHAQDIDVATSSLQSCKNNNITKEGVGEDIIIDDEKTMVVVSDDISNL